MSREEKQQSQQAELQKQLWSIANSLRGNMDANDFKNYILGLIFYRYLSENLVNYVENVMFVGKQWDSCQFYFYKDTLSYVGFGLQSDKEEVIDVYNQNIENARTKYDKIEGKMSRDDPNSKQCYFDDGVIILSIGYNIKEDNFANLIYHSRRIIDQMNEDAYNDI